MSGKTHAVVGMMSGPRTETIYAFDVDGTVTYVFSHGETSWHVPADDLDTALKLARANVEVQGADRRRVPQDPSKAAKP